VHFVKKVSLYFWNLRYILRLLIPGTNPILWKTIFGPLYSVWLAKNDLSSEGHLTKKLFCCFRYFYIKMNICHGYSHSKSNFRQKSTYPIVYTVLYRRRSLNHMGFTPPVVSHAKNVNGSPFHITQGHHSNKKTKTKTKNVL
jgi:hypothetical protein